MSLEDLYDHRIRIWRPVATSGPLREQNREYLPVTDGGTAGTFNATVRRHVARLANPGPGLAPIGERRVYTGVATDVQARDVVELLEGPDAPQRLEVDQPPTRPRGHHTQLDCRIWLGVLPTES